MKSIRIAGTVKQIAESDQNITLFRIQEILSEHRTMLITGILTDLPAYLQFKFYTKVDKEAQGKLRDKLFELSNSKVNLDRYQEIVEEIKRSNSYRVPSTDFFKEIDTLLDSVLNPTQLTLLEL
jgi:glycosylphosphatidylinositol transamidase (GPIT) subunit GPI8